MKLLGEKIFARNADGVLLSRIGTMFLRTPGLVTAKGVHAMQRMMWLDALNAERTAAGLPALTPAEENAELEQSVDLIFDDEYVLIRPDPERMDLAFQADAELQKTVSKRQIRYLNTSSAKVRKALCERGENWRMARQPISQEDMAELIASSRTSISEGLVYYYNRSTGTRFITASGYDAIAVLPPADFRRQIAEIVTGLNKRNRLGHFEVDIFPSTTPIEIRNSLKGLPLNELTDTELRRAVDRIVIDWRMTLPSELRDESVANFDWRNEMCHAITSRPNESAVEEQELIAGIAPEFYRQIEWLPGVRIDRGEVIFDPLYDEAARTRDPMLLSMCDTRVKSFLFNATRLMCRLEYVNIGRIARSLARRPVEGNRRGNVYVMQFREKGASAPTVMMIRLQKWGVAEHLDEGKDLLRAITEADEYSDYILDRRLMCRQLGMNLPDRLGFGHFSERYRGANEYNSISVRTAFYMRAYIPGIASDKVPTAKFRNPAWALRFAELMGEAAAVDMIVGRRSSVTHEPLFDKNYEVVIQGDDGLPQEIKVTDHAGSFVEYEQDFETYVSAYADVALRRRSYVTDFTRFSAAYVDAFARRLSNAQRAYRANRKAFDGLFADRPYDSNGSGAYRWSKVLERLDTCDPERVAAILLSAIGC